MALLVISLPVALAEELNLQYDANGNLVTGDSYYREYSEFNQLVKIREGNVSTGPILEEFVWHPIEERILIKDVFYNGIKNYSVYYVSDDFIRIENSSGNYTEKYIYQDGVLVAQVNNDGNKIAVHNDHIGSVSLLTDSNGNILEETFYSPYGEIIGGGKSSRFDYEGKEFDALTGTYDFHFRQINPSIPIWNKPDTVIQNVYDPQSLNRYMFERGNPYGNVDPDGHKKKKSKSIFNRVVSFVKAVVAVYKAVVNTYNKVQNAITTAKENLQKIADKTGIHPINDVKTIIKADNQIKQYIVGGGSSSGVSNQELGQSIVEGTIAAVSLGTNFIPSGVTTKLAVNEIRYSQNSIKATFRDGGTVQSTIDALKSGRTTPNDIPTINVVEQNGKYYSLDNRRLYAYKEAGVDEVPVNIVSADEAAKQSRKFTTENDGTSIVVRD